jgi:hypothetical protein
MIPVVYYHAGAIRNATSAPRHLEVSINQCKKFNDQVFLLGDESNSHLDVDHCNIAEYSDGIDEFRLAYKHMSSNSMEFEMACIERWIVLANFVKKMNLDKVVYLDSDIMTFCNYGEVETSFGDDYDAMVCSGERFGPSVDRPDYWVVAGCVSYWKHDTILKFKDFIYRCYSDKFDQLLAKWDYHQNSDCAGGICDMALMYLFYFENNLHSLCKVRNNSTFDQNFYVPENYLRDEYAVSGRGKTITWKEENLLDLDKNVHPTPYYHNILIDDSGDTLVRVNAIPELARFF